MGTNPDQPSEASKCSLEEHAENSLRAELHPDHSSSLQHVEMDRLNNSYQQGMFGNTSTGLQPMVNMSHENHLLALLNHQRLQSQQNLHNLASNLSITHHTLINVPSPQILPHYVARQVPQVIYNPLLVPVYADPRLLLTLQPDPNRNVESQINPFRQHEVTLPAFGTDGVSSCSFGVYGNEGRSMEDPPITHHSMLENNTHINQSMNIMADVEEPMETTKTSKRKSRAPPIKRRPSKTFEAHFANLVEFKAKYGHCNVPHRYKENPSLGNWCNNIRTSWRIMKDGGTPSSYKLTMDQKMRLDKIGFKWRVYSNRQFRADREY